MIKAFYLCGNAYTHENNAELKYWRDNQFRSGSKVQSFRSGL